jgi:hypothetical protein
VTIIERPSLAPVQKAVSASNLGAVDLAILITFDEGGTIIDAKLENGSGDSKVDAALLTWVRRVRLSEGVAGMGRIPVRLHDATAVSAGHSLRANLIGQDRVAFSPPPVALRKAMKRADVAKISLTLLVSYADDGKLLHSIRLSTTGDPAVDRELDIWMRQVVFRSGTAANGELPVLVTRDTVQVGAAAVP